MGTPTHLLRIGTIAAAWTLAGGVAGGSLVAVVLLAGRVHPQAVLFLAGGMAMIGSALGGVHGAVLGHLAHVEHERFGTARDAVLFVALIAGAFIAGVLLSVWLTMSATVARAGHAFGWLTFAALAVLAGVILLWATLLGWRAFESAFMRWPDHRLGGWLVIGAFALLSVILIGVRPAIPGTQLQLPAYLLLAFAALAALWVAAPAVVVTLKLTHRGRQRSLT